MNKDKFENINKDEFTPQLIAKSLVYFEFEIT